MKYFISTLVGFLLGYPQSIDPMPLFQADTLPAEAVDTIIGFGLMGGILMGIAMLNRKSTHPYSKYFHVYTFMLVGMLSICLPVLYRLGLSDLYRTELFTPLFFGSAGLGILLGALIWRLCREAKLAASPASTGLSTHLALLSIAIVSAHP
jgi:hypothetical protein